MKPHPIIVSAWSLAAALALMSPARAEPDALQAHEAHAQAADRTDFDLICTGVGEHLSAHSTYGYEWDQKQHKYVQQSGYAYSREQMEADVQVEIHDGAGSIRPAKRMVPPISSGGSNGWWPLHDLRITPDRIQASYKFNGLNAPTVDIDRRSGHIRVQGLEKFEGSCTAVEPDRNRF
ncbi:hypothetical protein ACYX7E_11110 [Luteimonas sp. RIT-PG2_3]|jgi:hypothetical protein